MGILWLLRSHLFIAFCAGIMVRHTAILFHLEDTNIVSFVMGATLLIYAMHSLLNRQMQRSGSRYSMTSTLHAQDFPAIVLGVVLISSSGSRIIEAPLPILIALIPTLLYLITLHDPAGRFRCLGVAKTLILAATWTYVTCLFPFLMQDTSPSGLAWLYVSNRFLLIYGICLLFDNRDQLKDKERGLKTLPVRLTAKQLKNVFFACIGGFLFTVLLLSAGRFPPVQSIALLIPGILLAMFFNLARKQDSEIFYDLVLDGLMALSPLLHHILSFTYF